MSCRKKNSCRGHRSKNGGALGLEKSGRHGSMCRTLLFGALLGLVVGLLFAPKPGPEMMEKISRKRGRLMEKLIRTLPV
ncbi:MAG: hypothetical protein ACYCXU_03895 [Thermoleophilia bacterium]